MPLDESQNLQGHRDTRGFLRNAPKDCTRPRGHGPQWRTPTGIGLVEHDHAAGELASLELIHRFVDLLELDSLGNHVVEMELAIEVEVA